MSDSAVSKAKAIEGASSVPRSIVRINREFRPLYTIV